MAEDVDFEVKDEAPTSGMLVDEILGLHNLDAPIAPMIDRVMSRVSPEEVNLRDADRFPSRCGTCIFFEQISQFCRFLRTDVRDSQTCDAFRGDSVKVGFVVSSEDMQAFASGLIKSQPDKRKVIKGISSPQGFMFIVEDSKGYRFAVPGDIMLLRLAIENGMSQEQVDQLIQDGRAIGAGEEKNEDDNKEE